MMLKFINVTGMHVQNSMELWKRKHETGQWLEIEAAEAMSSRSEFSAMNASGIMLANVANQAERI
jgi:hypothetical protein